MPEPTTPQPQDPPKVVNPPPSTPVSPTPTTLPEPSDTTRKALLDLQQHLYEAYQAYKVVRGDTPVPREEEVVEQFKTIDEIRRERAIADLRSSDVYLDFDIRLLDSEGEVFQIADMIKMNYFTEQGAIPESRRNFEATCYAQILRPLLNRIQEFLNRFVENQNPLPTAPMFGSTNVSPSLPTTGPSTFITDAGR